ncbi:MAG: YjbQ family protein [Bryobacteraceae bacterium]|nr:YjbQ family protein [Bryobacteraceae bacterium]
MIQFMHEVRVDTRGKGLYEFTAEVESWVRSKRVTVGLLTIYVRHTSASLTIQENADSDVTYDLSRFFERLVPENNLLYRHTVEGPDDMPAHIRAALTQTQLSIPVANGKPVMGTWQGIYLFEHRAAPHRRSVVLHFIGEAREAG